MALTRVGGDNLKQPLTFPSGIIVTGVATLSSLNVTGNVSIAGTLTYEDVTNIDSIGIVTARSGITVSACGINAVGVITATSFSGSGSGLTGVSTNFVSAIGIQSAGLALGVGITQLNFIGLGNTFSVNGTTIDISIAGGGGSGQGFATSNSGIHTSSSVGVNTTGLPSTLTGIGNSFQGIYVSNGMYIMDNTLTGNHYIGTNFNGLMAGPVTVNGALSIDGVWVVV